MYIVIIIASNTLKVSRGACRVMRSKRLTYATTKTINKCSLVTSCRESMEHKLAISSARQIYIRTVFDLSFELLGPISATSAGQMAALYEYWSLLSISRIVMGQVASDAFVGSIVHSLESIVLFSHNVVEQGRSVWRYRGKLVALRLLCDLEILTLSAGINVKLRPSWCVVRHDATQPVVLQHQQ